MKTISATTRSLKKFKKKQFETTELYSNAERVIRSYNRLINQVQSFKINLTPVKLVFDVSSSAFLGKQIKVFCEFVSFWVFFEILKHFSRKSCRMHLNYYLY